MRKSSVYDSVNLAFQRIVTERDSLREVNEELKCMQAQHVGSAGGDDLSTTSQMEMLSLPPEVK